MSHDLIHEHGYLFLGSRLKRLSERLQADVVRVSQVNGLSLLPGQYALLAIISEQGPQTIGALAQFLGLSQPAATKKVLKLHEMKFITTQTSGEDGRRKLVHLTSEGELAMRRSRMTVWPQVEAAVKEVVEGLSGPFLGQIAAIERALDEQSLAARAASFAHRAPPTPKQGATVPATARAT